MAGPGGSVRRGAVRLHTVPVRQRRLLRACRRAGGPVQTGNALSRLRAVLRHLRTLLRGPRSLRFRLRLLVMVSG